MKALLSSFTSGASAPWFQLSEEEMKTWQRRLTGILTLGGSFLGITLALQNIQQSPQLFSIIFTGTFLAIYCWGAWCGLALLEQKMNAAGFASVFWLLQIPYFMSPVIGGSFSSGASIIVYYAFGSGSGWRLQFGSRFDYSFMQPDQPFIIGLNLFALLVALFLGVVSMRPLTAPSREDTPVQ